MIKRFLPQTLLGRSLMIIVMPLILLQVVSAYIFYERHWYTITRHLASSLAGEIGVIIHLMETDAALPPQKARLDPVLKLLEIRTTLRKGETLPLALPDPFFSSLVSSLDVTLRRELAAHLHRPFQIDTQSYDREVVINVQMPEGVLRIVVSRKRLFSSTTYIFILWMVGVSLVLFAIATLFMRNQVRPLRRLAISADRFGRGLDVPDFKQAGALEVRQAASAFTLMRERIQRQISQRTEMLAGVSHDLRTPLTRIKLQLALMTDHPDIANIQTDINDMETMLEGYLAFARGEGGENAVTVNLGALLDEVVAGARREGAVIDLHVEGDMVLPLRRDAFKRALVNLLANSKRHAEHISVRAGRRNDGVVITIDDDGPGIPADKREEVFRPFYRLDTSRNRETGGVGLGLAISRDVIRGHGGDIALDASPLGGLRVRIRLPL
ncbi:HAMP domain-containing protein [Rhodospirillaceae bacterium AH-315-P19]|nr:HAMP domain-containing protein [Rhodospirillaceae bacterium AH-315-P19]